ncbi:MAG: YggS family pyridoxal phosphate-dependent enzyme [Nitrospirae bacterium]|nr:YggS family pyridoxal phosphate-dependent enzyme [Nitrospirota bacterium]
MLIFYTVGITANLKIVNEKISRSAAKAGRNPLDVKLVAVTKTIDLPEIIEAVKAGVTILGENRVQEVQKKVSSFKFQVSSERIEWHLIGHLQKNKAKTAVELFDMIQTVDSIELADEVNKQAKKMNKTQRVLLQVKLSDEETKHGVSEKDMNELLEEVSKMQNLKLEGLMTIPPFFDDHELARPYFRRLREIKEEAAGFCLPELSMGMSNDFEVAIEEGATMVRIGTAIFGERGL